MSKGKRLRARKQTGGEYDLPTFQVDGCDVNIRVRPRSTVTVEQAEWAARKAVEAAEAEKGAPLDSGERLGAYFAGYVVAFGRATIVAWDLVDDDGNDMPCDRDTIGAVLASMPELAGEFDRRFVARKSGERAQEGNGSAPAPNGISAAGANTATPAGTTTTVPAVPDSAPPVPI